MSDGLCGHTVMVMAAEVHRRFQCLSILRPPPPEIMLVRNVPPSLIESARYHVTVSSRRVAPLLYVHGLHVLELLCGTPTFDYLAL